MYWPCGVPQVYAYHGPLVEGDSSKSEGGSESQDDDQKGRGPVGHSGQSATAQQPDGDTTEKGFRSQAIIDLQTARGGHFFATITTTRLDLWSTRPVVVLASLTRSAKSLETYGANLAVSFKPDTSTLVIRTTQSYLITYAVESDVSARVLQQQYGFSQARRQSVLRNFGVEESYGVGEVLIRFRRAIKIDAGIHAVIALDSELVVATTKPAAVQCIKWEPQKEGSQAVAQLVSKMEWMGQRSNVCAMTHDRAMNLSVWLSQDGYAYAVQRTRPQHSRPGSSDDSLPSSRSSTTPSTRLFDGYCFHRPEPAGSEAKLAAINARFSLIAVATADRSIVCYAAKDYAGNIPRSHTFPTSASPSSTGAVTCLLWSPDGYCLFAGYEHGWACWSVFGKEGSSSFGANMAHAESNQEQWLLSVKGARWTSGGSEILLISADDARFWKIEISRSAAMGCFSCANLVRALLQTPLELTVYRGHELPDLTSISNEASLWHHAPYPPVYLHHQWPIKACVVSQDGRYIAIAGRRGLAHYSVQSGRWKTFSDHAVENSFAVRGGMCWFNHILAVATENAGGYDLRLYSRELELGRRPLHTEAFSMPIVFVGPSGEDSLLVYTYENILYHYVLNISDRSARLVQVGQIAFHGIVRAPSRVRSVSWVLPDAQLRNGDPSRDVEFASVLFLVDDKLVLLQPTLTPKDTLKYDMRVIAQHVEYYILMRDQIYFNFSGQEESAPPTPEPGPALTGARSQEHYSLRDSLWIFSGEDLRLWPDVRDVLHHAVEGDLTTRSPLLSMPVDFYPLSILLTKGVVLGIESELLQRRDVTFAQFRSSIRTQLFLPYVLRHQLCTAGDTTAAFGLANQYQHLSYFPHALEILLHHVLDDEVDRKKEKHGLPGEDDGVMEPLAAILSFLQLVLPVNTYLSTVVQCIRKTELKSWRTLFTHLPPPLALFEQALGLQDLKTASGYLIVLQALEEEDEADSYDVKTFEGYVVRLMKLAKDKGDFELCAELARFMMGIDPRGNALRRVVTAVGFRTKSTHLEPGGGMSLSVPVELKSKKPDDSQGVARSSPRQSSLLPSGDYFSSSPGGY